MAGKGLVAGVACVVPGSKDPDGDLAWEVVNDASPRACSCSAPVGLGGGTVKISPPLVINEEAVLESIAVLEEAFAEALGKKAAVA